jgi:transposase-like protein
MGSRCARGAQALGISENVLHRWKREAIDGQSNSELEVEKLRQRLKQVEMERDILNKALWGGPVSADSSVA